MVLGNQLFFESWLDSVTSMFGANALIWWCQNKLQETKIKSYIGNKAKSDEFSKQTEASQNKRLFIPINLIPWTILILFLLKLFLFVLVPLPLQRQWCLYQRAFFQFVDFANLCGSTLLSLSVLLKLKNISI